MKHDMSQKKMPPKKSPEKKTDRKVHEPLQQQNHDMKQKSCLIPPPGSWKFDGVWNQASKVLKNKR